MNRLEYIRLVEDWNKFLRLEEDKLIKENILIESILLNEGLRDIAEKYGNAVAISMFIINLFPKAGLSAPTNPNQILKPDKEIQSILDVKGIDNSKIPDRAAQVALKLSSGSTGASNDTFTIKPEDILSKKDIADFERKGGVKIFEEEPSYIPGFYTKNTLFKSKNKKEIVGKLLNQLKKHSKRKSGFSNFFIEIDNKKYIVLVQPDKEADSKVIEEYSELVSNIIFENLTSGYSANDDSSKEALSKAKEKLKGYLKYLLNSSVNKNHMASFLNTDHIINYFIDRFNKEIQASLKAKKLGSETVKFTQNSIDEVASGILFFRSGNFDEDKLANAIILHELGHLINTHPGLTSIGARESIMFYKFIESKMKSKNKKYFTIEDVVDFFLSQQKDILNHFGIKELKIDQIDSRLHNDIKEKCEELVGYHIGGGLVIEERAGNFIFTRNNASYNSLYFFNIEERNENLTTWINGVNSKKSDVKIEEGERVLIKLKKYLDESLKKDLEKRYNVKFNSEGFGIKKEKGSKKEFNKFQYWQVKDLIERFLEKTYSENSLWGSNYQLQGRLIGLLNFHGFRRNNPKRLNLDDGKKYLLLSIDNLINQIDELDDVESHEGHDHDH